MFLLLNMKCPEQANPEIESRLGAGKERCGVIANGYGVYLGNDENVLVSSTDGCTIFCIH